MALNSLLRRASGSLLPLAVRAVGSPRAFHGAISAVGEGCRVSNLDRSSSLRFSTIANHCSDQGTAPVFDSEIKCVQEPHTVETMLGNFPFKIEDSEKAVTMTMECNDETIKLIVDIPEVMRSRYKFCSDLPEDTVYSVKVVISKRSGPYLEYGVIVFPNEFTVGYMRMCHPDHTHFRNAKYENLKLSDIQTRVKCLEARGVTMGVLNYLHEHITRNYKREAIFGWRRHEIKRCDWRYFDWGDDL